MSVRTGGVEDYAYLLAIRWLISWKQETQDESGRVAAVTEKQIRFVDGYGAVAVVIEKGFAAAKTNLFRSKH